jgi:hypothetical protein
MSADEVIVVFTAKSIETLVREGGSAAWRLDRNRARQCVYVVCARNANADWVEGPEAHHAAFLVGKVKDVIPATSTNPEDDRYLIQFSQFARVNIPDVWKGDRNPVRYSSLDDLGIDPSSLDWEQMPALPERPTAAAQPIPQSATAPLTMAEAKKGLALTFGVTPEAIEITIRG